MTAVGCLPGQGLAPSVWEGGSLSDSSISAGHRQAPGDSLQAQSPLVSVVSAPPGSLNCLVLLLVRLRVESAPQVENCAFNGLTFCFLSDLGSQSLADHQAWMSLQRW